MLGLRCCPGFSLVAVNGGDSLLVGALSVSGGLSSTGGNSLVVLHGASPLWWLLLLWSTGPRMCGHMGSVVSAPGF